MASLQTDQLHTALYRKSFAENSNSTPYRNVYSTYCRAVARSENLGGLVVMGEDNVPTLVEIG